MISAFRSFWTLFLWTACGKFASWKRQEHFNNLRMLRISIRIHMWIATRENHMTSRRLCWSTNRQPSWCAKLISLFYLDLPLCLDCENILIGWSRDCKSTIIIFGESKLDEEMTGKIKNGKRLQEWLHCKALRFFLSAARFVWCPWGKIEIMQFCSLNPLNPKSIIHLVMRTNHTPKESQMRWSIIIVFQTAGSFLRTHWGPFTSWALYFIHANPVVMNDVNIPLRWQLCSLFKPVISGCRLLDVITCPLGAFFHFPHWLVW